MFTFSFTPFLYNPDSLNQARDFSLGNKEIALFTSWTLVFPAFTKIMISSQPLFVVSKKDYWTDERRAINLEVIREIDGNH